MAKENKQYYKMTIWGISILCGLSIITLFFATYRLGYNHAITQNQTITPPPTITSPTPTSHLANPASVNCAKAGGKTVIKKNSAGAEYGLCEFEDAYGCEEWALLNGNCPVGGLRTTGYDTEAQKYCAWLGGKTFAQTNATCTLPNGVVCNDEKLFNGTCSPTP